MLVKQASDDVDDDGGLRRQQHDVIAHAHIAIAEGSARQLDNQRLRYGIDDHFARQRLANGPVPGLTGWQATVVLLGQSRRAAAPAIVLPVVRACGFAMPVIEVSASPDFFVLAFALMPL